MSLRYVTDVLLQGQPGSLLKETIQRVKKIRLMVKANERLEGGRERAKELESKLDRCRNKVGRMPSCPGIEPANLRAP